MPYKNIAERRLYHRKYMSQYNKAHKLTEEQKENKRLKSKAWRDKNKLKLKDYQHKRYLKDKDKIVLLQKAYRHRNKSKIQANKRIYYRQKKDYFAQKAKTYYNLNKDKIRVYKRMYARSLKGRFISYSNSLNRRGVKFELGEDVFNRIMLSDCHYCGVANSFGIDRKDNTLHYCEANCLPCCKRCNYMKSDMEYDAFIEHIKKMHNHISS